MVLWQVVIVLTQLWLSCFKADVRPCDCLVLRRLWLSCFKQLWLCLVLSLWLSFLQVRAAGSRSTWTTCRTMRHRDTMVRYRLFTLTERELTGDVASIAILKTRCEQPLRIALKVKSKRYGLFTLTERELTGDVASNAILRTRCEHALRIRPEVISWNLTVCLH